MGITHDSVLRLMEDTHRGFLAKSDGEFVGFAMGDKSSGELWVIAVLEEYENRGIGRALMELVEGWLFGEGCEER